MCTGRQKRAKRQHTDTTCIGGIKCFLKDRLGSSIKVQKIAKQKHFLSLQCRNAKTSITVICAYLPHQNSWRYQHGDQAMDILAELGEYIVVQQKEGLVLLLGDLNSRTAGGHPTQATQLMFPRKTEDTEVAGHATEFMHMLRAAGMIIANGTRQFPES